MLISIVAFWARLNNSFWGPIPVGYIFVGCALAVWAILGLVAWGIASAL